MAWRILSVFFLCAAVLSAQIAGNPPPTQGWDGPGLGHVKLCYAFGERF